MARKRMFSNLIIDSDEFLDMPTSAQALYFHLAMRADDDGFVNSPRKIQRIVGASNDDCKLLLAKRFILTFESGIIVIRHWKLHNTIQKDRYKPTIFKDEKRLIFEDENGMYTERIQNDSEMEAQIRLDKISTDKSSVEESSSGRKRFAPPTLEQVKEYCFERNNSVDAQRFIDYYTSNGWMVGKNKMKDWKAAVRTWERSNTKTRSQTSAYQDQMNELAQMYRDAEGEEEFNGF